MDLSEITQQQHSSVAATHIVYLALGANIGKRQDNLAAALQRIGERVSIERVSSIYETDPVGYLEQPRFFNLVCRGITALPADALLAFVKQIERDMGRLPGMRNGPRPIDIDILLYDELHIEDDDLIIPHPRMSERAFVLVPLAEIAPDVVEPVSGKPIPVLVQAVSQKGITRLAGLQNG